MNIPTSQTTTTLNIPADMPRYDIFLMGEAYPNLPQEDPAQLPLFPPPFEVNGLTHINGHRCKNLTGKWEGLMQCVDCGKAESELEEDCRATNGGGC